MKTLINTNLNSERLENNGLLKNFQRHNKLCHMNLITYWISSWIENVTYTGPTEKAKMDK